MSVTLALVALLTTGPMYGAQLRAEFEGTGDDAVRAWWATPLDRGDTPRDELVIKLALAVTVPGVDVTALVQRQRTATLRHLQDLTRLERAAGVGVAAAAPRCLRTCGRSPSTP